MNVRQPSNLAMARINNRSKEFIIKHRDILVCLFLILATFTVYWQVQNYDFVNFDDSKYTYENRHVQEGLTLESITWAFTTIHASNWHPLTWLSHMLDYQLYGMNPGWHHLTNLFLHIANTLLLFLVFRKMTDSLWQSGFVAALFALHPLHVESVAWVSERKDVLSTFFWMLTMWSYIWYVEHPAVKRYILVVLFFALGLMSKPMLVTLPFVLLLLDFYPLNRFQSQQPKGSANAQQRSIALRLILEKIPLFVLVAMSSAMTFYAQKHGGAVKSLDFFPLKARLANALVSYVKYIGKMVYPSKLAVLYPHPGMLPWWKIAGAFLLLVSISFLAIRVVKQSPYFAVGWLWYLGTLVPVIGLVQVGIQSMADRYTYVPLIGIFIIIAWGIPELVAQWQYSKIWLATLATVVLTILMAMTWKQVGCWENSITLFEHTLKVTTNNYVPHNNLGMALENQGHTKKAIEHYLQALQIKPDYEDAHYNLGLVLDKQGRTAEAIEHYLQALRIKPDFEKAHNNLGAALDKQGRTEEAIEHYLQALRLKPDYEKTHNNLGAAFFSKGRIDTAIVHFREALRIKPDYAVAQDNLKQALAVLKEIDTAIYSIKAALNLHPENPELHYNLGLLYQRRGKLDAAIYAYRQALSIEPEFIEALNNLALVYMLKNENDKALALFTKLTALQPNNAGHLYNLACIYSRQNQIDASLDRLKKAIEKGYDNWNLIKTDKDLENIRNSSYYQEFVKGH